MKILHVITSLQTGGAEKLMVDLLPRKLLTLLAIPAGIAWYLRIRHKVRTNAKMNFR